MIAVTFALPTESANFIKLLDADNVRDTDVRVIHTGVGEAASSRTVREFLAAQSPDLLISSGFAGALTDELQIADLLLAQNHTSPEWLERARAVVGEDVRLGVLTSAPTITDTAEDRAALAARTNAIAVDMETEFIATACREASVPIIALRAISDTPAARMPAPPHVLFDIASQRTNYLSLARHVMRHPGALPRLVAFARRIADAREKLTDALATLVRSVR